MKTRLQSSKLIELRAKTDRQLVQLIDRRIEAGLSFLRWAAESHDRAHWTSKEIFHTSACQAYDEARNLLPWAGAMPQAQRLALEFKLAQLHRGLACLAPCAELRVQTA